ncbi:MAG TPA: hypothetical protein VM305_06540 [Candidatus Limnocylindrales bacterium]|nr:hypothetical protein [Candidatus Limnocylindrales bacterium]
MTEKKSLKRRVRERMSRTGERYTAARRQVLAKTQEPAQAAAPGEPAATPGAPPPALASLERGPSDQTLADRTGRPWEAWLSELESWGAADKAHALIARWLVEEHGVDGWWAQTLTVRYEKHIGRRVLGQRGNVFTAGTSRTIAAPAGQVFDAFVDPDQRRRWLPDLELSVRTATAPRNARFNVGDGRERLIVGIEAKGDDRATIHVEHERLVDAEATAQMRDFWRLRLAELKHMLEG